MLVNFVRVSALPVVVGLEPTGGDTLSPPISLYVSLSLSLCRSLLVAVAWSPALGRRRGRPTSFTLSSLSLTECWWFAWGCEELEDPPLFVIFAVKSKGVSAPLLISFFFFLKCLLIQLKLLAQS